MSKFKKGLLVSASVMGLLVTPALANSSGSFTAGTNSANCTINSASGAMPTGSGSSTSGHVWNISSTPLTVHASGSGQTAFVITPSAVTGLYTDNKVTSSSTTSTEDVGVQVQVNVSATSGTPLTGNISIAPKTTGDAGNTTDTGATCTPLSNGVASCVIYDQRFVQVKAPFLNALSKLTNTTANTTLEMIQSTLSAHSFNFYVQVPNAGNYQVTAQAQLFIGNNNTSATGTVAGCFGPGTLTVQQVQNFKNNSTIGF